MGFSIQEITELLDANLYVDSIDNVIVKDFEYSFFQLKENLQKGLCFISISKERWCKAHGKTLPWKNGNEVALRYEKHYDVLITEVPIKELRDTKIQLIVEDSYEVLQKLSKAARLKMRNPVIAITGSVGKSSTRLIMEQLLKDTSTIVATRGNHNTQAGVPLYCAKLCTNPDIGILEISLNALNNRGNQSLVVRPNIAIVTSIGEAHLSTLHSTINIASYKARIFEGLEVGGIAIINADIAEEEKEILIEAAKKRTNQIKFYSMQSNKADLFLRQMKQFKKHTYVECVYENQLFTFTLEMPSVGMVENILGVLLCLLELNYDINGYLDTIKSVRSLERVMEVKEINTKDNRTVTIIDDSHNAAIPSMINAILTFNEKAPFYKGNKLLVLGQVADLGDQSAALHQKLLPYIQKSEADIVIGHGKYMREIIRALPTEKVGGWFTNARTMSKFIPYLCTDDSFIVFKGSVSGGDFQKTSQLLPIMLRSSDQIFSLQSPRQIMDVLQPVPGLIVIHKDTHQTVHREGYSSTISTEGIGAILFFIKMLELGVQNQVYAPLSKWATNRGKSINGKMFKAGTSFSNEELMTELTTTQHPTAIFELSKRYFKSTRNAMKQIEELRNKLGLPEETALNLTGRFRIKEQQRFTLETLKEIAIKQLLSYKDVLPSLSMIDKVKINGIVFGHEKKSLIGYSGDYIICATGYKDIDKLKLAFQPIIVKRV